MKETVEMVVFLTLALLAFIIGVLNLRGKLLITFPFFLNCQERARGKENDKTYRFINAMKSFIWCLIFILCAFINNIPTLVLPILGLIIVLIVISFSYLIYTRHK